MTIRRAGFTPLGWFTPQPEDNVPEGARFLILIGNAGPDMFRKFQKEAASFGHSLDRWTEAVVGQLAETLAARAIYPFGKPPAPFLTWARRAGAGHQSPLGLNIHPTYGLWHAFRAALVFDVAFDLPPVSAGAHPCESCAGKPCLSACPVGAFDGRSYDVGRCADHIASAAGEDCMAYGCLARRACPVGRGFTYEPAQAGFHMQAFLRARRTS